MYCDVFYQPGENPVFCYRSGMFVYEEQLFHGALISLGINTAGYPLNVLTNCPTRLNPDDFAEPAAFSVEADGISLDYSWALVSFEQQETEAGLEAVLTLRSSVKPVSIAVHTLLGGYSMFTRRVEIINESDNHIALSRLMLLGGPLETMHEISTLTQSTDPSRYYDIGYFTEDGWGREGSYRTEPLTPGFRAVDTRFGRERYRHPALFIFNRLLGTVTYMQMGWSGGCRFALDYRYERQAEKSHLAYGMELTGYKPLLMLRPGETFALPEVHCGAVHGNLDDAVNQMHSHTRRCVLNLTEADPAPCLVGCGMGAEHDMSMATSINFIDQFAAMGGEIFIIDAGWECPPADSIDWGGYNGMNHPNPDRYPDNGLMRLRDYCHEKGLKFALWVEIERLGKLSDVYKEHPDWRAYDVFGRQSGGYLDLTNPEAAAWAEEELARIITEYGLELLRVDYNVGSRDYFMMRDTAGCGVKECVALRHFNAVYGIYQRLKKRFPHVIFENCAGGGGRTDLGHMKAFHHTWVSDWQNAPRSGAITNGMTMVLPPERVDRLFAGMGCHAFGGLDFHMRNTMLGHMSLNVISPAAAAINPEAMAFVQHSVAVYKEFIRPILPTCHIYHHTPEAAFRSPQGFCITEIAAPNGQKAALTVLSLTATGEGAVTVFPKGLRPGKCYRVTLDNSRATFEMSGEALQNSGLRITLPANLASELVLFEVVK